MSALNFRKFAGNFAPFVFRDELFGAGLLPLCRLVAMSLLSYTLLQNNGGVGE